MAGDMDGALKDRAVIRKLTEGCDLSRAADIEKVYKELISGGYTFVSKEGRDFDDEMYELHEKVLSGEIVDAPIKGKKSKNKKSGAEKSPKSKVSDRTKAVDKAKSDNKSKSNSSRSKSDDEAISLLVQREIKKREKRRKLVIVLAAIVAVGSLGYYGVYYYISNRTSAQYEQLSELKGNDVLSSLVDDEDRLKHIVIVNKESIVIPDLLEEYKTLYAKNKDFVGWLSIEGTKIDYPVMQTDNNDFYLSHNFNKENDNNGSLFLDCSCMVYPQSTNMIIYGHHMKSGNMFGNLQKYAKESYYKEHSTISFDTIYEKGTYEIMYVFYSKVYDNDDLVFKYYQFINANSEKEFKYYMDEMAALSLYDTGVTANYGDTLLTLSTCDHSQTDGRFAVVAKRIN